MTNTWRNRIVGEGEQPAGQFLANPHNWRLHPRHQQDALKGTLDELGWIQRVIVNRRSGHVVDGHARITLALRQGEDTPVPYLEVDLSDEEERLALATLDPISALAATDGAKLDELLQGVNSGDAAVQQMLAELAEDAGIVPLEAKTAEAEQVPEQWMVLVTCDGEQQQTELLEQLAAEGYQCRALVS